MLVLNEKLQKVEEGLHIWFCQIRYLPLEAVSTLLTKMANLE